MFSKRNLLQDGDFIVLQTRVSNLELEIEKMKTHINSLRGLVNRKLGQEAEKEDLKTTDPLEKYRL